ncbi:MAG: hypothetical protein NVS1B11_16630 [Terriglobales bacterium]
MIARGVTKLYEEFLRGKAGAVLESIKTRDQIKGEITLLIGKSEEKEKKLEAFSVSIRQRLDAIMSAENLDEKAALKKIAKERGISKSAAYRELQRSK